MNYLMCILILIIIWLWKINSKIKGDEENGKKYKERKGFDFFCVIYLRWILNIFILFMNFIRVDF